MEPHRKDACSPTVSDIRRSFRSLRIRQYKGLEDVSLDEAGSFNLLVGANDVGKTSVLEAIFLLTGLSNIRLPGVAQAMRELDPESFGVIESIFRNLDTDSTIEISASMRDCDEFRDLKISTGSTNGGIQIGSTPMSQGTPAQEASLTALPCPVQAQLSLPCQLHPKGFSMR
ncbi:MAG: AAA family ATPase [Bacteroidota bacterium]|nr:AAA family ATPase [Bacteroidota bacterium]